MTKKSWNTDSFLAGSSLYKVNSSFVSSGTIDGSLDHDYYVIDGFLTTGSTYEIHLTSDSTNHGWSSNNESTFLEFDLYDYNNNLLGLSTLDLSRSPYDDVLEFTVPSDYKSWQPYYIDVHGLVFDATDYALTLNSVNLTPAVNNQPLGSVTISGTEKVGETLTASSSVSDADGINASTIEYEWCRGSEKIIGATVNTYTLTENDIGKTIKVKKTYTDNLNNEHSVTSESTSLIKASSTNDSINSQSANDKTLIIVLDNFSERVHEYDNTTLYDFGYLDLVTFYDNYYDIYTGAFSDYGNYDDLPM